MPSWRVHRLYASRFLEEKGANLKLRAQTLNYLIDLLVDAPHEAIKIIGDRLLRENKLLALMLTDDKLKPLEPLGQHDWGAWQCCLPSVEAARRVGEIVSGRLGRLLVDLHLSLDYVWNRREVEAFVIWAEKMGIEREVIEFVLKTIFGVSSE